MTHATPTEIHDHAYGFRASAHVAGCAECRRRADDVSAERSAIRDALVDEPAAPPEALLRNSGLPTRRKVPLVGLAAAAVLLATLAWLLFHFPAKGNLADAGRRFSDDSIDRFIVELRSSSPLRREIAVLALKAYGEAALEKIALAKVDPALFAGYRLKARDQAVSARLDAARLDMSFENAGLGEILDFMAQFTRTKIVLDPSLEGKLDDNRRITFKVQALSGTNCLKLLLSQLGIDFRCEEGKVVVLDPATEVPSAPRAPVRIGRNKAAAIRLLEELRSDSVEQREDTRVGLQRMGFAAEEALWEALDKPGADARARAADLLRRLYSPGETAEPWSRASGGVKKTAYEKRVTIDMENAPVTAIVDYVREASGLNIHISGVENPDSKFVSFKGTDLPVYSALILITEPHGMTCLARDGVLLVTREDAVPGLPQPPRNFWTSPEEAQRIDQALASLTANTLAERDRAAAELSKLGDRALGLLDRASRILEGEAVERCRALRARILETVDPQGYDEPSADELQPRILSIVGFRRAADLDANGSGLADLLKPYGEKVALKAKPDRTFTFQMKGVKLETLLKSLTRPYGLDFYVDDGTIVVDTAANVRAALEKRK